jgi:predicted phage baseplate assembly protein
LPPEVSRLALNVLPVLQLETRHSAPLGFSRGLPAEAFPLALDGLVDAAAVRIEVAEAGVFREWKRVLDLGQAAPSDACFLLDSTLGRVVFGNGVNGRIPPAGAQLRHLDYVVTRGAAGNIAAGMEFVVPGAVLRDPSGSYGNNYAPFAQGADAWGSEELRAEARTRALERRVLLTDAELERAARELPGLGVARADVQHGHPALRSQRAPGARTLVVTPERAASTDALAPVPERYLRALQRALEPRRVLGERLTVIGTRRVPVSVSAVLLVEDGRDGARLSAAAQERLNARLSDVQRPGARAPWPVGRDVTSEEMQALLAAVDGVLAVTACSVARPGSASVAVLRLESDEVAIGVGHRISVRPVPERKE